MEQLTLPLTIEYILIDPFSKSLTLKEYTGIDDVKKDMEITSPLDVVRCPENQLIVVDDDGLLKNDQRYFKLDSYHQPLAGRAIFIGEDKEGEFASPIWTIDDLAEKISWMPEDTHVEPMMEFIGFHDMH
tara:strand:+ start:126 stop:515 length:390 start_codon:yes stop_codon:yes gene_type:complete